MQDVFRCERVNRCPSTRSAEQREQQLGGEVGGQAPQLIAEARFLEALFGDGDIRGEKEQYSWGNQHAGLVVPKSAHAHANHKRNHSDVCPDWSAKFLGNICGQPTIDLKAEGHEENGRCCHPEQVDAETKERGRVGHVGQQESGNAQVKPSTGACGEQGDISNERQAQAHHNPDAPSVAPWSCGNSCTDKADCCRRLEDGFGPGVLAVLGHQQAQHCDDCGCGPRGKCRVFQHVDFSLVLSPV